MAGNRLLHAPAVETPGTVDVRLLHDGDLVSARLPGSIRRFTYFFRSYDPVTDLATLELWASPGVTATVTPSAVSISL